MIGIRNKQIDNVPLLLIEDEKNRDNPLPLVIYLHGFTSAKEHNLPIAYLLAERGFRVVLPDSLHHGVRENGITDVKRQLNFWTIVQENLKDIVKIKNYFAEHKLIKNNQIALSGTSMGGITTAAALSQFEWISSAAILMGTAKLEYYGEFLLQKFGNASDLPFDEKELKALFQAIQSIDLSQQLHRLQNRPLFIWHGDNDQVIPHATMESFYEKAKTMYTDETKIQFVTERGRGHKVSRSAILKTVDWFCKHMI